MINKLEKGNTMVNKVFKTAGYLLMMSAVMFFAVGCEASVDNDSGGGPNTDPPPPPPWSGCDFPETEFNDTWQTPNFITNLPVLSGMEICGELTGIDDVDNFYFFLQPSLGNNTVRINFYAETDPDVIFKIRLIRPIYNKHGQPTGDYDIIWNAFSHQGEILILDLDLEYDDTLLFDLLLEIEEVPFSATFENHEYTITFWS